VSKVVFAVFIFLHCIPAEFGASAAGAVAFSKAGKKVHRVSSLSRSAYKSRFVEIVRSEEEDEVSTVVEKWR
jgi:hypothetical protein